MSAGEPLGAENVTYIHTMCLAPLTPPPYKANWPPYHRAETIRLVGAMYVKGGKFLCLTLSGPFFFLLLFLGIPVRICNRHVQGRRQWQKRK